MKLRKFCKNKDLKLQTDFEKQKYEDERRFKHEKWLEDQKRQILEAKLKNARITKLLYTITMPTQQYQQQQPQFQPPPMTSQSQGRPQQVQTPNTAVMQQQQNQQYDPSIGFNLMLDHLFNVPREYRQMRLVYSVFLEKKTISEPRLVDTKQAEADMDQPSIKQRKVFFNANNLLKHIKCFNVQHPSANIIVELQVPDPNKTAGWSSLGWSILNVFDNNYNLNKGK